jgi:hypothetical protein
MHGDRLSGSVRRETVQLQFDVLGAVETDPERARTDVDRAALQRDLPRGRSEVDHRFLARALERLAGAQHETRSAPASVVDVELEPGERLGSARSVDARFVDVRGDRARLALCSRNAARGVARAAGARRHLARGRRAHGAQQLDLAVAQLALVHVARRFHRQFAQRHHHVVLHHVADGAGCVVERAAALHRERLFPQDFDLLDLRRVPERGERWVEHPQRQQVLHGGEAEHEVDAIAGVLAHVARDLGEQSVQRARAVEIDAERLFDRDPAPGR